MITKPSKLWRIVTIRNWGRCSSCDPTHSSELRRASWLNFDAAFGAGWPTCTPGAARALVSLASIAECPENNRCVSTPHDDMHRRRWESHGWRGLLRSGRVIGSREDGDSSTATGLVRLHVQTWVVLATANGRESEKESDERRRKAEHGGTGTSRSRTAPRTISSISVDKAGLFSRRLRAWRFVGSVTRRRGGPPAYRPSGRDPGCGFASGRAIPPPSQAGVGFGLWLGSPVWF